MTTNETTTMNDCRWVKEPRWLFNLGEYAIRFWYELTPEQKDDIKYMHRASATLHRIAENQCNGHPMHGIQYRYKCDNCGVFRFTRTKGDVQLWHDPEPYGSFCGEYKFDGTIEGTIEDEAWKARDERLEATITKKIQAIADKHGWKVEFQGDPRGAVVKLEIDGRNMTDLIA